MVEVMGVELDGNVPRWEREQRRVGSLLVLGVAVVALAAGALAWFVFDVAAAALYYALVGVVVLVLVLQVLIHVLRAGDAAPAESGAYTPSYAQPRAGPAHPESVGEQRPAASRTLTLRCGDCGTVFDLTDNGERPLYHACPGCGAEGVMRDPAPQPAPQAAAHEFAPPESARAPPSGAAASSAGGATVKRLKLRCGGCKEVFSIEDTGERPLRRPCPYCARMGEVR